MPTTTRAIPGFLPSTAGLHFGNSWPHGPAIVVRGRIPGPLPVGLDVRIGDTADGLCGGMALVARDRWVAGDPPPPDRVPPDFGTPLFSEIVRRQVDSLELGLAVARFYRAGASGVARRDRTSIRDAWPAVRREIDAGRPAGIGLIHVASADPRRLVGDHQVVAYGYVLDAAAGTVALAIYDPNHPDDDTIRLRLSLAGPRGPVDYTYIAGEAPVLGLVPLGRRSA